MPFNPNSWDKLAKFAQVDPPDNPHMGPLEGAEAIYEMLFGSDGQSPIQYLPDRVEDLARQHPAKADAIRGAYRHYLDAQFEVDQTFASNLHDIIGG